MKIAIRMDDIYPEMDMERFLRFRALLDKNGIRPLIGVIPDCRDPKLMDVKAAEFPDAERFWQEIRTLKMGGFCVAMHGLTHVYTTGDGGLFPLNRQSEFAGLPYYDQLKMIRRGREIMASYGLETDIFMAPSHSYDHYTLTALRETGFKYVTDGFGQSPYMRAGLIFLPISVSRGKTLKDNGNGYSTFVIHSNTMDDADFKYYENLFTTRRESFISFDELLSAPVARRSRSGHAVERATALTKRTLVHFRNKLKG